MADAYGNVMTGPSGITQVAEVKPVEILFSTTRLIQKGVTMEPNRGVVVGGTVLARLTASGRYVPYAPGAATDGSATAVGVLRQSVDTDGALPKQGNIVLGGVLKADALIGLDAGAVTALNGRTDTARNMFTF